LALPRTGQEHYASLTPRLFHAFQTDTQLVMVQTYYACGSLWDVMSDRERSSSLSPETKTWKVDLDSGTPPREFFSVEEIRHYAAQIALAIGFLHDNNVVHRDVKPHNVLIGLRAQAVLSDFGSAASLEEMRSEMPDSKPNLCVPDKYTTLHSIIMRQGGIGGIRDLNDVLWPSPKYLTASACSSLHGTLDYIAPEGEQRCTYSRTLADWVS